jgi:tRNA U34 5-methylaminomethyl-2-thiouridine-forming methyltransferase MnmC
VAKNIVNEDPKIVTTEDGSITCFDQHTGELYHNRAGAYTEALKTYVEPCCLSSKVISQSTIQLLDVCFGLGYNSFVFLDHLSELLESTPRPTSHLTIQILGIDQDDRILKAIPTVLADHRFDRLIGRLMQASERGSAQIKKALSSFGFNQFNLTKNIEIKFEIVQADIRKVLPKLVKQKCSSFDFIFHDGFSPRKVPELWTLDLFKQYTKLMKPSGRIITYSSAPAVRGALKACALEVKKTTPVGGKSGGTIAAYPGQIKLDQNIFELSDAENLRLESKSSTPYRDPDLSDSANIILNRRQKEIEAKQSSLQIIRISKQ